MDHISRIGLFLKVAQHQSFASAARELGMTGPALSKQVQTLEDNLGVRLLQRTTRHVSLTEEGAIYGDRARKALEDLEEAERYLQELKACPTGLLKINAPMSFGRQYLAKPIAEFAKTYPDVRMDIDFDDRNIDMIAEGYDVSVRVGALEDSSLIARKLAPCPIIPCASPSYVEQHGQPKTPAEMQHHPAIIYTRHSNLSEWRFQHENGENGSISLTKHFAANNAEMMLEACLYGLGIAILPIFTAAEHLQSGALLRVLPEYQSYPLRHIYAIFPQNRHLSTRVRLFIDWLTQCSEKYPWG